MQSSQSTPAPQQRLVIGALLVLLLAVVGLFIVKWSPYYAKAFAAAAHHTIGNSIVSGKSATPPRVGWTAAWTYALAYYNAIWQALVLGLLLGATVQVFFPRRWLYHALGTVGMKSVAFAGMISMAGMMCTCCAAPVVIGLRKQRVSTGAAMAFFIGNPILNPATLLFIGFVLSWQFAALRLALGIALILVVAWYANRTNPSAAELFSEPEPSAIEDARNGPGTLFRAWLRVLWWEAYTILPGYIAIVLVLGATRAWLFAPTLTIADAGILGLIAVAIVGTLFVIPTAGEVPIIQTLMGLGMGIAPAATLLMTLPAISLPSVFIIWKSIPKPVLAFAMGAVAVAGLVAAALAMVLNLS
jgi:uncharacterized protein